MKTFGKKTVEIEYTKSLNCDMCGANCVAFDDFLRENYATLQADWGYGSKYDGLKFEVHLCEDCFFYVLDFIRNERNKVLGPAEYPHENDPLYGENNE